MRLVRVITVAALVALPAAAQAQQRDLVEMLRGDINAVKTQVLTEALQLPDSAADRFWPVYRQYTTDLAAIQDARLGILREWSASYDTLSAARAGDLARRVLDTERRRIELLQRYQGQVSRAVGPLAAARFVQVEMLITKLLDVQLAAQLPLIGDRPQGATPAHNH